MEDVAQVPLAVVLEALEISPGANDAEIAAPARAERTHRGKQ